MFRTKEFLTSNTNGIFNGFSYAISGALATVFHDAVMNPAEVTSFLSDLIH